MKAVIVRRGETQPVVTEVDEPTPGSGEALLRTLRVGIDGTDHEVIEGNHGGFPNGEDYQILGHEAVAVVADANGTDLEEGQLVVPTVRRPREAGNEYFERGEPDMAPDSAYVERGIVGAHGYMAEYFTSAPRFLIPVPDTFAESGFLVEPISNAEKALEHAHATRSAFEWEPETGLVLGNGPLGLLTLGMLAGERTAFSRAYCLGRRDRPDPTIDIIEGLGATYVDSRETPVDAIADVHEPMDFVCEATGYARHAFRTVRALRPNGVGALLGIPESWSFEIDGGALHRELVLQNKALFGSVNSNIRHFEAAIESLAAVPNWFVDNLITGVYEPATAETAFETTNETIKSVVKFSSV